MSNLSIIIGREYMTRVKKKSFIILTIIMPFLMVAIVSLPMLLGSIKGDDVAKVAIIDSTGSYAPLLIEAQETDSTKAEGYTFAVTDKPLSHYASEDSGADAVIYIFDNLAKNPKAVRIYSRQEVQQDLLNHVQKTLGRKVRDEKLASYNMPELKNIIADVEKEFTVQTVKWNKEGDETVSSGAIAMMLGLLSAILIYMFVLSYGATVMQGVMEEKTNRIVEVIVGSVRPFELMMGKIIGIMLVGLTQMMVWLTMIVSLTTIAGVSFMPAAQSGPMVSSMTQESAMAAAAADQPMAGFLQALYSLPLTEICVLFVLFFLGGYILYSSFYAAIGAAVNSQEDSAQFMMPMMIIMVFSIYAAMGSMENTDGPLAFWASIFPLSSPIVMMVRLPFGVPLWQELLSIGLLYATAALSVYIAGRIYRVGILMYGKKPSLKEMIKWMRYK